MRFKRGLEETIPSLFTGEPGFTTDSNRLFIGSDTGNVELAKRTELLDLENRVAVVEASPSSPGATTSRLQGKVWNVLGDSITEVNYRADKRYYDYITEQVGCSVNNYGVSGTGWFTPSSTGGTNQIFNRVNAMADADIITVFAGTNDWGQTGATLSLGTVADTTTATFCGAVYSTLTQLITKYPTKTIAVITPLPRASAHPAVANSAGYTMKQVVDSLKSMCERYSIPYLDLFNSSGLFPWNATNNSTYFSSSASPTGDGLHPNALGHEIISRRILSFLETIV